LSWKKLHPRCQVILLGDDAGTRQVAEEYGVEHYPQVERNHYGTPLVNSVFEIAARISENSIICYVNADMILMSDFLPAVEMVGICDAFSWWGAGGIWISRGPWISQTLRGKKGFAPFCGCSQ